MQVTVDDGVTLATVVAGPADAPGLLLVHGFGGAKEDFADHLDALAAHHRVVTFDHRGHGDSAKPADPRAYSLDRLAADSLAVARACELHDLRVLGHSMGGMVARRLALAHPDALHALVLMDTSPGAPPGIDAELVTIGVRVAETEGLAAVRVLSDGLDLLGSPAHQRVFAERPGFPAYLERRWAALSPVMWATLAREIVAQPDQLAALSALPLPTLVIVGEQDATFLAPSQAMAEVLHDARLVVVPDAGHSPQFENPLAWREALLAFLDGLA